jgi:hypothetical protein
MEVYVDIDEELLREFDGVVRVHNITRNIAVRGAITAWRHQARRDAALRELFDAEFWHLHLRSPPRPRQSKPSRRGIDEIPA